MTTKVVALPNGKEVHTSAQVLEYRDYKRRDAVRTAPAPRVGRERLPSRARERHRRWDLRRVRQVRGSVITMDRMTNDAVVEYRKYVQTEFDQEQRHALIGAMVAGLTKEQLRQYVEATTSIDAAGDQARADIDELGWGPAVSRVAFRKATNRAGMDREVTAR